MSHQPMGAAKPGAPELMASGLGWPEGPTVMPDHSLVFVDTYHSQLTIVGPDRSPRRFAYTAGGPNSCVLGSDGALYVCRTAAPRAHGEPRKWSRRRSSGCARAARPKR